MPDTQIQQPTKKVGVFSRLSSVAEQGLRGATDIFISPLARELQRPFVSVYRGVTGTDGAVETPFGAVEPYSELSSRSAAAKSVETALTVLPVEKIAGAVAKPFAKPAAKLAESVSKVLPGRGSISQKGAQILANVPAEKTKIIQESPELVRAGQKVLQEGEAAIPAVGQEILDVAKSQYKKAQDAWQVAEQNILKTVGEKLPEAQPRLVQTVKDTLEKEGIRAGKTGVDLRGTALSQNSTAQRALDAISSIVNEESDDALALLNKRAAITSIIEEIPQEAASVRRVAKNIASSIDSVLDDVTGGQAGKLRQEYARVAQPTREIIDSMTDDAGRFSADKARLFVNQVMSDVRFDNNAVLSKLDEIAGTGFSKQIKAIGAAKAIERLDPITGGRVGDVLKTYVVAKIPGLSALVSPKFWGETLLRSAEKTQKAAKIAEKIEPADQLMDLLIQNLVLKLGGAAMEE